MEAELLLKRGSRGWVWPLAWLPIPLLLAAIIAARAAGLRETYELPTLRLVLSFVFYTLVSLGTLFLIGRSFLARGTPGLLLLECGVILWSLAGTVGDVVWHGDQNVDVTIFNTAILLAGMCHLAGSVFALRPQRALRARRLWLAVGCTAALGALGLVTWAALGARLPVFFIPGQGGTPMRYCVLIAASAMFALSAGLLRAGQRRMRLPFTSWYALAMLTLAVGLLGIMIQFSMGSIVNWLARCAQWLGGVYLLVAALAALRESNLPLFSLEQKARPAYYRDAMAVAVVLAAAAVRLAFLQVLGASHPFLTFYPAVMLAALYGGLRPGLLATVLSAALADYFWIEPAHHLPIGSLGDVLSLSIFLACCTMISGITETMLRAQVRVTAAEAEARAAAERQRAAEALAESEQRYRNIFNEVPVGLYRTTPDGQVLAANPALVRMLGYESAEKICRRNLEHDGFEPDYPRAEFKARIERDGEVRGMEAGWRARDDRVICVRENARAIRDESGQIAYYEGTAEDITERKQAEQALRESEERFRALVTATSDVVYRMSPDWREMRHLSGQEFIADTEAPTRDWLEKYILPEDQPRVMAVISDAIRTRNVFELEHRIRRVDGSVGWTFSRAVPIKDARGAVVEWFGSASDVTARKQAEEALQELNEQLETKVRERTADLQQTNERLEEENRQRMRSEQSLRLEEARLDALLRLSQMSESPLNAITAFTLEEAIALTGSKIGFVGFLNEDESIYTLHAVSRDVVKGCNVAGDPLQWHVADAGIWADAIRSRKTLFVNDYRQPHARKKGLPPGHPSVQKLMVVPILESERIVALAGVANKATEYDPSDERQVILLLKGMWSCMQKSQAREELQRAYGELEEKVVQRTAELRASEERLRLLGDNLPDSAVFQYVRENDGSAGFLYFSAGVERLNGVTVADVLRDADTLRRQSPPEYIERLVEAEDRSQRELSDFDLELPMRRLDGELRWMRVHSRPRHLPGGRTIWDGVQTDITERRQLEQEREVLLRSERAARTEAERASHMKDEFIATLSHELRNPLNAILGWAQLLKRPKRSAKDVQEGAEIIVESARSLADMISDLLDISRIASGKLRLDMQTVDLRAVITAAAEAVKPAIKAKGMHLKMKLDPAAGPVQGDPNRLRQVVWNLLSNAAKFTDRGGRVEVTLRPTDSQVEICVADTGQGIDPDFLPHVFDRFRQEDAAAAKKHGGLGLGLSIVRNLVEMHGGTVEVASPGKGRGATFTVRLPVQTVIRAAQPPEPAVAGAGPLTTLGREPITLAGLKVLAVDDEYESLALIQRVLEERRAQVFTATSAAQGMELLQRLRPDVLVSDIGMPEEDGFQFMRRVRALDAAHGGATPALALTAFAGAEHEQRAMLAGYQVHLSKPVEVIRLVATVANLAGRPA